MEIDPQALSAWIEHVDWWMNEVVSAFQRLYLIMGITVAGIFSLIVLLGYTTSKKFKKMENRIEMLESHMAGWYKAKEDE